METTLARASTLPDPARGPPAVARRLPAAVSGLLRVARLQQ
ncbi:hypothetical protein [Streptomyces hydrogenans]